MENSTTKASGTDAAYGIYDATASELYRLISISFANEGGNVQYTIPQGALPKNGRNITVRYLTAPSIQEKWNITWGAKTWNGAVDENPVNATNGQVRAQVLIAAPGV